MARCKENELLAQCCKERFRLGRIARLMPVGFWQWWAKKMTKKYKPDSKLVHIPTGIRYNREVLPREVFDGSIEMDFEDTKFLVPVGYDKYLSNLYGDYMQVPPPEKRERHIALALDFGKYGAECELGQSEGEQARENAQE